MTEMGAEGARTRFLARRYAARNDVAAEPASDVEDSIHLADLTVENRNGQAISRVFALSSLVLALAFAKLAINFLPIPAIAVWLAMTATASLLPIAVDFAQRRRPNPATGLTTQTVELLAVILAAAWAMMPALFFEMAPPPLRTFCGASLFAISGLGAFAFVRASGAAVAFVSLIAGSTALASLKVGGEFGAAFAVAATLYGVSLSAMVLTHQIRAKSDRRAREEIRRQQETVAFLLNDFEEGASDWLWETDSDFKFTYASPRLAKVLGVAPAGIATLTLGDLAGPGPQAAQAWAGFHSKLLHHLPIAAEELPSCAGPEPQWLRIAARPLMTAGGVFAGYRGVGRDVTAEKQSHDQLVEAKTAAEQANAAKSQFLAVISHELRTPLNAIVGFSELLSAPQSENISEATRNDHLQTILESSRHLQNLISDILDATRFEKGTMRLAEQDGDAAELLEVAVKMCRDLAESSNCTIIATLADGIEVRGDITRIKQVLINLITNAIKFSPAHGFVYAGLERWPGGELTFTIRDGGMGIAADDAVRIFEPFVQVDDGMGRRFGGMGLGLSIARKLARLHGGDVTLESVLGTGTTARLILPASRVTWPAPRTAATTAA